MIRDGLSEAEKGVVFALLAHLVWGGMAFYFGLIRHISPVEIAVHRGLWALPIAALIVWWLASTAMSGRPSLRRALLPS